MEWNPIMISNQNQINKIKEQVYCSLPYAYALSIFNVPEIFYSNKNHLKRSRPSMENPSQKMHTCSITQITKEKKNPKVSMKKAGET